METITVGANNESKESNGLAVVEDGKTTIKCLKCDYTSDKVTNCRRHFETMHTILRTPEQCCGISFQTKGDYRDHRKVAHPGGLYFCHLCPAEPVKRKALLVRHMSIHTGIKQHTCKLCGYASPNKFNVKRHMVTHSVTSANTKTKEPKIEKSSENKNTNNSIVSAVSSSLVVNHSLVLPDSTTDSLLNPKPTPILMGMLKSEDVPKLNEEEKRGKSISHSINDILNKDSGQRASSAVSSYYKQVEPRFPGNKEEGEIKMTSENWSGIDESCTKGYCYNWSHVSTPGSSFTTNLQPYPYELPFYFNNYEYLPPRLHAYNNNSPFSFFQDSSFSEINPARFLPHETNFLSPYEARGFGLLSTTPENLLSRQYYLYQQKPAESEQNFKVCQQNNSQAVLINQQDSRFVPDLGVWTFKDTSTNSLLPTLSKHNTHSKGTGLSFRPPVAFTNTQFHTDTTTNPVSAEFTQDNYEQGVTSQDSKFIQDNSTSSSIHDYHNTEKEHAMLEYIPKKLRLSKKFLTNSSCTKT